MLTIGAAAGAQQRCGREAQEVGRTHVDGMHAIPGRDVDTGDGRGVEDRGVVDQHIETRAQRVQRFDDEFAGMGVGQILAQGQCRCRALRIQLGGERTGFVAGRVMMNDDVVAERMQRAGGAGAEAFGGAGDERHRRVVARGDARHRYRQWEVEYSPRLETGTGHG
jgi:hypothetical protein